MNIDIDAGIMIRNKQTGSRLKYDEDPVSYETCYDTVEGVFSLQENRNTKHFRYVAYGMDWFLIWRHLKLHI